MPLLYVDIDGALPPDMLERIRWTCAVLQWPVAGVRMDRTRRGWHVVVNVRRRLAPLQIVAAQAVLGSDPRRETFNLQRATAYESLPRFWRARWNVLYDRHLKPSLERTTT